MCISFFRRYLILSLFFSIALSSCGIKKTNDVASAPTPSGNKPQNDDNKDDPQEPIVVSPKLGVSAIVPKDVLYVATAKQKQRLLYAGKIRSGSIATVFSAKGAGGIGEDLNEVDSLDEYPGIPLILEKKNISDEDAKSININITASGDEACKNLFNYDKESSQINFANTSNINELTVCHVQVSASGAVKGQVVQDSKSFPVSVNPTLVAYAQKNDPAIEYIKKKNQFAGQQELKLIAKWLKDPEQIMNLRIDQLLIPNRVENINSLIGARNTKSINLSKTSLKDTRALVYFPNLEALDISDSRVDPKDLANLGQLKNLKSLSVRNLGLKDLTFITNNIPNLVELDISDNTKIEDLSEIKNLKDLKVLKASNIGLKHFDQLAQITQINTLDISRNDLSKLSEFDLQNFVNLYALKSLNVSESHIKDDFLNKYFEQISLRNNLTTFIDRNQYIRTFIGGCENINTFDKIPEIMNLTNLKYLDLHGQSCNDSGVSQKGLTKTAFFSTLKKLETLNISNTVVYDLSGVDRWALPNLKNLILVEKENGDGISMSKETCFHYLGDNTDRSRDCQSLPGGKTQSITLEPGIKSWPVPRNVFQVKITGCSGSNSGAGGGGGGAGATIYGGNWNTSSVGGDGGASGNVNGNNNSVLGISGKIGNCTGTEYSCRPDHQAGRGTTGGDGGVGVQTYFGSQKFSLANSYVIRDPSVSCLGGANGNLGNGGKGIYADSKSKHGGNGGDGGANTEIPWSSRIETYTVAVTPWEDVPLNVGAAGGVGTAGIGATGQGAEGHDEGRAEDGKNGEPGIKGTNGFLRIEWSE